MYVCVCVCVCVCVEEFYIGKALFKMDVFFAAVPFNIMFWGHFNVEVGMNPKVSTNREWEM